MKELYCSCNELSSGQLAKMAPGRCPVSLLDEAPNSRILLNTASADGNLPARLLSEMSTK